MDWAYDQIVEDDDLEIWSFRYDRLNLKPSPSMAYPPLDHRVGVHGRRAFLTYVDLQDVVPPNAHVISATLNVTVTVPIPNNSFSRADTVATVLMTNESDGEWHQHHGIVNGLPHYSYANWHYQVLGSDQGGNPVRGHPQNSGAAWSPPLAERMNFWDYGDWFDWCSTPKAVGVDSLFAIDITDCVQGIANGAVNNGFFTYIMNNDQYAAWDFSVAPWEGPFSGNRAPWITIKYATRPYQSPFPGGREWAFVFSTDDQEARANNVYTGLFAARNMGYTIYVREDKVGRPPYATWAQLINWHQRGMEVGSHSRYHWAKRPDGTRFTEPNAAFVWYGLNTYFSTWGDIGTFTPGATLAECTTGFDSLLVDSDPSWLYGGAYAAIGDSLRDDPTWGKSLAPPGNVIRPEVLKAVQVNGYRAARSGQAYPLIIPDGNRPLGFKSIYFRPGATDTLWAGMIGHHQRQPRNLVWHATNYYSYDFVGQKADTAYPGHLDSVRVAFRKAVKIARAQNVNVINLFTHALKSDRIYTYGINAEELDAILDVVEEENGWAARASDFARWNQSWATPVATPLAYAQNDSFRFGAADLTWYVPDGVDGRFMRGLRTFDLSPVDPGVPASALRSPTNSPNPFNPQTVIRFDVRRRGNVTLRVYDPRGRLVRTLVDEAMTVGSHEVKWAGDDRAGRAVASGTYICALEDGAGRRSCKMMVLR